MLTNWWRQFFIDFNEVGTALALIVGVIWVAYKIKKHRVWKPKLNFKPEVQIIKKTPTGCILSLQIEIENKGSILATNFDGDITVYNLDKLDAEIIDQDQLSQSDKKSLWLSEFKYHPEDIEPGEKETASTFLHIDWIPEKLGFYFFYKIIESNFFLKWLNSKTSNKKNADYGWNNLYVTNLSTMSEEKKEQIESERTPQSIIDSPLPDSKGVRETPEPDHPKPSEVKKDNKEDEE